MGRVKSILVIALVFVAGVVVGVVASQGTESRQEAASGTSTGLVAESPSSPLPDAQGVEAPSPETEPETETTVGSKENPVPAGDSMRLGDWTIEVVGFTADASDAIHRENQFNDKPKEGEQYVLVTLKETYEGNGSSDPYFDQTWALVSEDGTLYEEAGQVLPKELSSVGNVPGGVSGVGNVAFLVPSEVAKSSVLYVEATTKSFDTEGGFFQLG